MSPLDPRVEDTITNFSRIYLGGIAPIITNDSSFLSFICGLTAIEALAGFRYPEKKPGARFNAFVKEYFPTEYKPYVANKDLWTFRNRMIHAFSPVGFALTHHQSEKHFQRNTEIDQPVLNAEDFYAALVTAAQSYFIEVRQRPELRERLIKRLESSDGGSITVGTIKTLPYGPT